MIKKRRKYTASRTSPKGGKRGCLCPDGKTYSSKCCDGSLQAQGIGNITGEIVTSPYQGYEIQGCEDSHIHHAHYHGELTVGGIYYIELENGHNGCHTVLREVGSEGIHIDSATVYETCEECTAAN
jgi:hypothetical protein